MPGRGRLRMLAVGQSLLVSRAIGSLPIEILLNIPVRPEHDSAPVRCPHRLLILCRVQSELGCSVVLPLVHPNGELLAVVDLDGEARAVWRERGLPQFVDVARSGVLRPAGSIH